MTNKNLLFLFILYSSAIFSQDIENDILIMDKMIMASIDPTVRVGRKIGEDCILVGEHKYNSPHLEAPNLMYIGQDAYDRLDRVYKE